MSATTGFAAARTRNLLIAILLPIAIIAVYLASLGGATSTSAKVPALIVNSDQMVEQTNADGTTTPVVAGRLLVSWLTDPANAGEFDWELANPEHAAEALRDGTAYVVVTIPDDFSASIVSAGSADPQAATVDVATNQAHDYLTGAVSQRLFDGLIAEFGQTITGSIAIGLAEGIDESADGLQQAADGAGELADGAGQLGDGFGQLRDGQQQLADGASDSSDGAGQLADGAGDFEEGVRDYVDGVGAYTDGASELADGVGGFVDGVGDYADGAADLASGVGGYTDGVADFTRGVDDYSEGVDDFADGVVLFDDGMQQLAEGAAPLSDAAGQLGDMAGQLQDASGDIETAVGALEQLAPFIEGLAGLDPSELYGLCELIDDPEQAAGCTTTIDDFLAALDASGVDPDTIVDGFDDLTDQLSGLSGAGDQLGELADGLGQFADGVSLAAEGSAQLADGAGQLQDAGERIRDGGAQLRDGGGSLADGANDYADGGALLSEGGGQLADGADDLAEGGWLLRDGGGQLADGAGGLAGGASQLADGLSLLADGQQQLVDGGEPLADGITELGDGAQLMSDELAAGADEARGAIPDKDAFADVVAQPVGVSTASTGDPGLGGMIAALGLPIGVWLAGLVTGLRRRIVTDDLLESTASTGGLLIAASRRLVVPVAIAAGAIALAVHLLGGAPWAGIGGTILFAALAVLATVAAHLLLAVLWGRRTAAIVSAAALAVQLLLVRGFVPHEWRPGWVEQLAGFLPIPQAAAGMQALYAGAPAGTVAASAVGLVLVALALVAVAVIALARRRRTSVGRLLAPA
ncbi:MAG: hypothetical protein GXX90_09160 [Microbacteriaceae bacterium]|nr:hypothetical protein [Microbacteriaceae bacterium]